MQPSFFEVTPTELGLLGMDLAVSVLREMLWAEARIVGIPSTAVEVPSAVMTADGGVDATVKEPPLRDGHGLIFGPTTAYQVKSGPYSLTSKTFGSFEELLMEKSTIAARKKMKVEPADHRYTVDDINPSVRACLDAGGTFVVALFGDDNPSKDGVTPESAIQAFLGKIDDRYKDAKIKIWRQSAICGLLRNYPGLCLRIKNNADLPVLSHFQWAQNKDMQAEYLMAPDQDRAIATLRQVLSEESNQSIHIRLVDEPGIGKSRLILEVLRTPELSPLVLYASKGTNIDGAVVNAIGAAPHAQIILVVDECSPEIRSMLANRFGSFGANLKIISIYQDPEEGDRAGDYRLISAPKLPQDKIEEILTSYGVEMPVASQWAKLCEGSPRVAHVVGDNLVRNPNEPLHGDGLSMIWDRYLAGDVATNTDEYKRRKLILSCLSLFKRFGWDLQVRATAFEVLDLIVKKLEGTISKAQFIGVVQQMKDRKILQGDKFLYITPKALHMKLWTDWWKNYRGAIDLSSLIQKLSPTMQDWFGDLFEYAKASPVLKPLVDDLLGPNGIFPDSAWLNTKEGSRFFFNLSRSEPASAIRCLERTIGKLGLEELRQFSAGRRRVVSALEDIAVHGDLFRPTAKLLLDLAEAENETWTNNASGVFAELFSLGYGELAPTSLAPEHRLPVLTAAVAQGGARRALALKAFDEALGMRSMGRWASDPPFLTTVHIKRWKPETYGEWYAAYRLYWQTLAGYLKSSDPELRQSCAKLMVTHIRELLSVDLLQKLVLDTLDEIAALDDFDQRIVMSEIEIILAHDTDGLPPEVVTQLESVVDRLVGTTFGSRLKRWAGMDLLYDKIDGDGNEIDGTAEENRNLAREALETPEALRRELSWLITDQAQNGHRFGRALGEQDTELSAWPDIREAWFAAGDTAHDFFIGGYLYALFARDREAWDKIIEELAATGRNIKNLPGLIWRSGMSERSGKLLLDLAKAGTIEPENLALFSMGQSAKPISDELFGKWLEFLMSRNSFGAAVAALQLASMSLMGGRELSLEQIHRLVTQVGLNQETGKRHNVMSSHHWLQLAKKLVKADPAYEVEILAFILGNMTGSGAVWSALGPDGNRFVDELVSRRPAETWGLIEADIRPPMETKGYVLTQWIRGEHSFHGRDPGPIRHIPRQVLWDWIAEDPERRAPYIVGMAPKDFEPENWTDGLIRELLIKFGDSSAIRSAAYANFFTGGWVGPASSYYATQKERLKKILDNEPDPTAQRWLREAIDATEDSIQRALIEEEGRGF